MSKPKYSVGNNVIYLGEKGRVIKVWTTDPNNTKYTVQFRYRKEVLGEGKLKRA